MSRIAKLATLTAATAAAAAMTLAPTAASASTPFTANLSGNMVIKSAGLTLATCTGSVLSGTEDSSNNLTITSASVTGCGVTVTPENLPWGGSLAGTSASITGFRVSAAGCVYSGNLSGTQSPSRTAVFTNAPVTKVSGGFLCPGTATVTATYVFS